MVQSWIGGDIDGLQHMGIVMRNAPTVLEGVVKALSSRVDDLVDAAGWQGEAATSFRGAWTEDALTVGGLTELVAGVGGVLANLAGNLAGLNSSLQNIADDVERKGIRLGPEGQPPSAMSTTPGGPQVTLLADYIDAYNGLMGEAQQARLDAANQLQQLMDAVDPSEPLSATDQIAIGTAVRQLWSLKDESSNIVGKKLDDANADRVKARQAVVKEQAVLAAQGYEADLSRVEGYDEWRASLKTASQISVQLASMEDSRGMPFDGILNTKLGDVVDALDPATAAYYRLPGLPDFVKDIPVLDIAAAASATYSEASKDHEEGWSWPHAIAVDGTVALGGIGGGILGGQLGGVALEPIDAAPFGQAGGGVIGTVWGGDIVDAGMHEHWSELIHDHGVIPGVAQGVWSSLHDGSDNALHQGQALIDSAGGIASDVWNAATSWL